MKAARSIYSQSSSRTSSRTIESAIRDQSSLAAIEACNSLFPRIERKLYVAHVFRGKALAELKPHFLTTYGISGRHFNSLAKDLEGRLEARRETARYQSKLKEKQVAATRGSIKDLDKRIKACQGQIFGILNHKEAIKTWQGGGRKKRPRLPAKLRGCDLVKVKRELHELKARRHQKKRRLTSLEHQAAYWARELETPRLCFGSRRLLHKQHHLKANGYQDHGEWLKDWREQRQNQSYWLGTHSEPWRNRNAQYNPFAKTLSLRMPYCLEGQFGERVLIEGVAFSHLSDELAAALTTKREVFNTKKRKVEERYVPVSYRLICRQVKGVRRQYVQACFKPTEKGFSSSRLLGAIGIDLNADHIAVCECDRFGNPVAALSFPFEVLGRTKHQLTAQFGDHIAEVVAYAAASGKPIVCERLDFGRKKEALRETATKWQRRMLSQFAYQKFFAMLASRCLRFGVELLPVNPAFTSLIGFYKFSGYTAFSSHELAALAIARRGLHLSERVKTKGAPTGTASIHDPGEVSSFFKEARVGHVWSYWSRKRARVRSVLMSSSQGRMRPLVYNPLHPTGYALCARRGLLRQGQGQVTPQGAGPPTEINSRSTGC